MRVRRPILGETDCTAAISIRQDGGSPPPGMSPATFRFTVPLPDCSRCGHRARGPALLCAAAPRKRLSSASVAKRPAPAAGRGAAAASPRPARRHRRQAVAGPSEPRRLASSSRACCRHFWGGWRARRRAPRQSRPVVPHPGRRRWPSVRRPWPNFGQCRVMHRLNGHAEGDAEDDRHQRKSVAIRRRASELEKIGASLTRSIQRRSGAARDRRVAAASRECVTRIPIALAWRTLHQGEPAPCPVAPDRDYPSAVGQHPAAGNDQRAGNRHAPYLAAGKPAAISPAARSLRPTGIQKLLRLVHRQRYQWWPWQPERQGDVLAGRYVRAGERPERRSRAVAGSRSAHLVVELRAVDAVQH